MIRFATEDETGNQVELDETGMLRIWSDGDRMAGAYLMPGQLEALAVALIQSTPFDAAAEAYVVNVVVGDAIMVTPRDFLSPHDAVRLGLALIRAAGRAKEER